MFATPWDWSYMDYSSCEEYDIDWSALDLNFTDRKDITWWDLPYVNTTESRTCRNGWVYELETYGPTATSEVNGADGYLNDVKSPLGQNGRHFEADISKYIA